MHADPTEPANIVLWDTATGDCLGYFTTLPEYTARRGQVVTVLRPLAAGEEAEPANPEEGIEQMWKVKAEDGWEGDAFDSELLPLD